MKTDIPSSAKKENIKKKIKENKRASPTFFNPTATLSGDTSAASKENEKENQRKKKDFLF